MKLTSSRRKGAHYSACAALLATAPLLGLVGCSGSHAAQPSPLKTSATATQATTPPADLEQQAKPAVALVDQYAPSGYPTSPVASGYDWAKHSGQEISENLSGKHLFQIACAGSGRVLVTLTAGAQKKEVPCGQRSLGFTFTGKLDAIVDGSASNTGTYAWRILAKA